MAVNVGHGAGTGAAAESRSRSWRRNWSWKGNHTFIFSCLFNDAFYAAREMQKD